MEKIAAMTTIIRIVIFGLVGLGALFCIIATATDYWVSISATRDGFTIEYHTGLWRFCISGKCEKVREANGNY